MNIDPQSLNTTQHPVETGAAPADTDAVYRMPDIPFGAEVEQPAIYRMPDTPFGAEVEQPAIYRPATDQFAVMPAINTPTLSGIMADGKGDTDGTDTRFDRDIDEEVAMQKVADGSAFSAMEDQQDDTEPEEQEQSEDEKNRQIEEWLTWDSEVFAKTEERPEIIAELQSTPEGINLLGEQGGLEIPTERLREMAGVVRQRQDRIQETSITYIIFGDDGPIDLVKHVLAGGTETLGQTLEGFGTFQLSINANLDRKLREKLVAAHGEETAEKMIVMNLAIKAIALASEDDIKAANHAPDREALLLFARRDPLAFARFHKSGEKDIDAFLARRTPEQKLKDRLAAGAINTLRRLPPFSMITAIPSAHDMERAGKAMVDLANQVGVPKSLAAKIARAAGGMAVSIGISIVTYGTGAFVIGAGQGFYVQKQRLLEHGIDPKTPEGLEAMALGGIIAAAADGLHFGRLLRMVPDEAKHRLSAVLWKAFSDGGTGAVAEAAKTLGQNFATWEARQEHGDKTAKMDEFVKEISADVVEDAEAGMTMGALTSIFLSAGEAAIGMAKRAPGSKGTGKDVATRDDDPDGRRKAPLPGAEVNKHFDPRNLTDDELEKVGRAFGMHPVQYFHEVNRPVPVKLLQAELDVLRKKIPSERTYPTDKQREDAARQAVATMPIEQAIDTKAIGKKILSLQPQSQGTALNAPAALRAKERQYDLALTQKAADNFRKKHEAAEKHLTKLRESNPELAAAFDAILARKRSENGGVLTVTDYVKATRILPAFQKKDGTPVGKRLTMAMEENQSQHIRDQIARIRSNMTTNPKNPDAPVERLTQAFLARADLSAEPGARQLDANIDQLQSRHPEIARKYAHLFDAADGAPLRTDKADVEGIQKIFDLLPEFENLRRDIAEAEGRDPNAIFAPSETDGSTSTNTAYQKSKSLLEDDGNTDGDDYTTNGNTDRKPPDKNENREYKHHNTQYRNHEIGSAIEGQYAWAKDPPVAMKEKIKGINPFFGTTEADNNCASCVMALTKRLTGDDVNAIADPPTVKVGPEAVWEYYPAAERGHDKNSITKAIVDAGEGSVALIEIIQVDIPGRLTTHAILGLNIDGKARFFDPQWGKEVGLREQDRLRLAFGYKNFEKIHVKIIDGVSTNEKD